jgi:hypothetical protein
MVLARALRPSSVGETGACTGAYAPDPDIGGGMSDRIQASDSQTGRGAAGVGVRVPSSAKPTSHHFPASYGQGDGRTTPQLWWGHWQLDMRVKRRIIVFIISNTIAPAILWASSLCCCSHEADNAYASTAACRYDSGVNTSAAPTRMMGRTVTGWEASGEGVEWGHEYLERCMRGHGGICRTFADKVY